MCLPDFSAFIDRFKAPGIQAIALMGSFARGDAGRFSDIDLVQFTREQGETESDAQTHIINDRLVVVSEVTPDAVNDWFSKPEVASECIKGVQIAKSLWDVEGYFREVQMRARRFVWDASMQRKADRWASQELVGWAEEVHKGLEGLRTGHVGRLLNARHGLSWGLTNVMRVQRGVLMSGDNNSYLEVVASLGEGTEWVKLSERVFGLREQDLANQVRSGLKLYILTVRMLADHLDPNSRQVIDSTVAHIEGELRCQDLRLSHTELSYINIKV